MRHGFAFQRPWLAAFCALLIALLTPNRPYAQDIKSGDRVTVLKPGAEFRSGDDRVGSAAVGDNLTVDKVNGKWSWISAEKGYISREDVARFDLAMEVFAKNIRNE